MVSKYHSRDASRDFFKKEMVTGHLILQWASGKPPFNPTSRANDYWRCFRQGNLRISGKSCKYSAQFFALSERLEGGG